MSWAVPSVAITVVKETSTAPTTPNSRTIVTCTSFEPDSSSVAVVVVVAHVKTPWGSSLASTVMTATPLMELIIAPLAGSTPGSTPLWMILRVTLVSSFSSGTPSAVTNRSKLPSVALLGNTTRPRSGRISLLVCSPSSCHSTSTTPTLPSRRSRTREMATSVLLSCTTIEREL